MPSSDKMLSLQGRKCVEMMKPWEKIETHSPCLASIGVDTAEILGCRSSLTSADAPIARRPGEAAWSFAGAVVTLGDDGGAAPAPVPGAREAGGAALAAAEARAQEAERNYFLTDSEFPRILN